MPLADEDRRLLRAVHDRLVGSIGDETPGGLLGHVARQDERLEALERDVRELLEERRRGGPASPPPVAGAASAAQTQAPGALAAGDAAEPPAEIPTPIGPLRLPRSWRLPAAFVGGVVALEVGHEGLHKLIVLIWKTIAGG